MLRNLHRFEEICYVQDSSKSSLFTWKIILNLMRKIGLGILMKMSKCDLKIQHTACSNFVHYQLWAFYIIKAIYLSAYKNSTSKLYILKYFSYTQNIYVLVYSNIFFYNQAITFDIIEQIFIVVIASALHNARLWGYSFDQNRNDLWHSEI